MVDTGDTSALVRSFETILHGSQTVDAATMRFYQNLREQAGRPAMVKDIPKGLVTGEDLLRYD